MNKLQQLIDKAERAAFIAAANPEVVKALVEVALVVQREVNYEQELEKNPRSMGVRMNLSWARHFRTEALAHLNDVLKEQDSG